MTTKSNEQMHGFQDVAGFVPVSDVMFTFRGIYRVFIYVYQENH